MVPLAAELWLQSSELNAQRTDHPLCGGAIMRLSQRKAISCQHALFMLRWLGRAPEDFLTGPIVDVGEVRLPVAGTDRRRLLCTPPSGDRRSGHDGPRGARPGLAPCR